MSGCRNCGGRGKAPVHNWETDAVSDDPCPVCQPQRIALLPAARYTTTATRLFTDAKRGDVVPASAEPIPPKGDRWQLKTTAVYVAPDDFVWLLHTWEWRP